MTRKIDAEPDYIRECANAADDLGGKYVAAAAIFGLVMAALILPDVLTNPDPIAPAYANVTDRPDAPTGNRLMASWNNQRADGVAYKCDL
ncbi:hypothetical protein LJR231_006081 [Phyllobacterium sp. LjRoot231]|uniref:hypothetical protein n=1 Tax=Phyllobacterium sp. LjRoot231 TaxID=3342289 RepID=UPI003ED167D6